MNDTATAPAAPAADTTTAPAAPGILSAITATAKPTPAPAPASGQQAPAPAAGAPQPTPPTKPPESQAPWWESLPEGLRLESIKKFHGPDDLAKSYVELEKKLGQRPQGLVVPNEQSTPEQWAEYRKALGIPEAPEQYELHEFDPAKFEQYPLDDARLNAARQWAHEQGLSGKQFDALVKFDAQYHAQLVQQSRQQEQQATAKLRQEWGDEYDARLQQVAEVAQRTGLGQAFAEAGMTDPYAAAKALELVAKYLPKTDQVDGKAHADLDSQIQSVNAALAQARATGNSEALAGLRAQREALYRKRYGGGEA